MEDLPASQDNLGSLNDFQKPISFFRTISFKILCGVGLLALVYYFLLSAPRGFTRGVIVNIPEGGSLRSVSLELKRENIIRSTTAFETFVIMYGGEKHIIPSDYLFEEPLPVFEIARRISHGEHHLAPVKVTVPEGFDNDEIAQNVALKLKNFDKIKFLAAAKDQQGYLFPDTYFFFTTDGETEVIKSMSDNFQKKIAPILPEITASGKSEKDIIIMASLIEREAKGDGDRAFISGILWRRISIGMPLQADAAPETYKNKGLPQAPISNPGIEAIEAAIHPQKSSYLYYLHDTDGNIHYAKTFEEHKANEVKYLH